MTFFLLFYVFLFSEIITKYLSREFLELPSLSCLKKSFRFPSSVILSGFQPLFEDLSDIFEQLLGLRQLYKELLSHPPPTSSFSPTFLLKGWSSRLFSFLFFFQAIFLLA